jgi:chromosome partitioning protein
MEMDPSSPEGHIPPLHPDYDPLDHDWNGRSSIADIFLHPEHGIVPYPTLNKNLDIAPAHAADLESIGHSIDVKTHGAKRKEEVLNLIYDRFSNFLSEPDVQSEYEYVVIDTAPSKGHLTKAAIRAASHLIIPSVMEDKPIRGIFGMLQLWMQESISRPSDRPIHLLGILPNMFDERTTLHKDLLSELTNNPEIAKYMIPNRLNRRIQYAELDADNSLPKSLFDLPIKNKARQEVEGFCSYIFDKIIQEQTEMEAV